MRTPSPCLYGSGVGCGKMAFTALLVFAELHPANSPEIVLLGQPLVDRLECLVHMRDAAISDLLEMLWHQGSSGQGEGLLFKILL